MTDREARELNDRELLEELLTFPRRKSSKKLSAAISAHFDGMAAMTSASLRELRSIWGMDRDTARFFRLLGEISGRVVSEREARNTVTCPARAVELLTPRLRGLENEALLCLCLDKLWRPVDCVLISEGGTAETPPGSFDILRAARSAGSRAVILAHNHPPGSPCPSVEDAELTQTLAKALKDAGITLVDHLVISRDGYVSMAESGFLPPDPLRDAYLQNGPSPTPPQDV